MTKKLYRSSKNRVIAGVCGGLGEFLSIDAEFNPYWHHYY